VGSGVGLRQPAASTDSGQPPEVPRRSLGLPWLIAVVVIPLLIAAIGYGGSERHPSSAGPAGALPTLSPSSKPGAPALSLAPLSITRNGNDLTLAGDFPDDSAKAALMQALNGSLPPGVRIVDQIHINPNVDALDFAKAGPIFKATGAISDFNLTVNGDTITLAGTAASQDQKSAIDQQAVRTWPNLKVVDRLGVGGPVPPPVPGAAGQCGDLQAAITAVTGGPITFGNDGFSLTPADVQILTQVAEKLRPCSTSHATVNGYADNSGTEAINIALSTQRAQTVVDFLVGRGVAAVQLVVKGLGSVSPVAPNDTVEGRAKNRRVEIVVS
jgi:peptidoglycan-binding protein ArfA